MNIHWIYMHKRLVYKVQSCIFTIFWKFLVFKESLYIKAFPRFFVMFFWYIALYMIFIKKVTHAILCIFMHKMWVLFYIYNVAKIVPKILPFFTNFLYKTCIQYVPIFPILTYCKSRAKRFCVFTQQNQTTTHKKSGNQKIERHFLLISQNQNPTNPCGTRLPSVFVFLHKKILIFSRYNALPKLH